MGTRITVSAPTPDLVVHSVNVNDSTLIPWQEFTISATVENQGSGSSSSTITAPDIPLNNTVALPGLINGALQQGSWRFYYVDLPSGGVDLVVNLYDLPAKSPNDLDLYVKFGNKPTFSLYVVGRFSRVAQRSVAASRTFRRVVSGSASTLGTSA